MSIIYNPETKIFQISTLNTTYMMGVYSGKHLLHLYYGRKVEDTASKGEGREGKCTGSGVFGGIAEV